MAAQEKTTLYRGSGRVAFLKYREEIEKKVAIEGMPIGQVYKELGDKMPIGYKMFHRYVQRYITSKTEGPITKAPADAALTQPERPKSFNFDATAQNHDLSELV